MIYKLILLALAWVTALAYAITRIVDYTETHDPSFKSLLLILIVLGSLVGSAFWLLIITIGV